LGQQTFLGLDEEGLSPEQADILIQPVPYDATTSFQPGTRFGPEALLQASTQVELWDEELQWEPFSRIHCVTLPAISPNHKGPEWMLRDIEEQLRPYHQQGKWILAIGGEHSIAVPLVKGVIENHPDSAVVVFDAHGDLRDTWEGTAYSHACTVRRIVELGRPVFHLGLRSLSREEEEFIKGHPLIRVYTSREIREGDGLKRFQQDLSRLPQQELYLSLDLDCLDPSLFPGTGTPEPGGMNWDDLLMGLKIIARTRRLCGADLCELSPLPGSRLSEFVAAKAAFKLLSYVFYFSREEASYGRT